MTRTEADGTGNVSVGADRVYWLVGPVLETKVGALMVVCANGGADVDKGPGVFVDDQNNAPMITAHKNRATTSASSWALRFFSVTPIWAGDSDTPLTGWEYRPGVEPRPCSRSALAFLRASRM